MKLIVKWCLFLIFVNIFIPMIAGLNIFPNPIEEDSTYYEIDDIDNLPSDSEAFEQASGYNYEDLTEIGWETFAILGTTILFGVAFAKMTRSLSPLLISLFFATFINIYRRSSSFISSFDVNPYIILAFSVGVLVFMLYTIIEYFHQGDASDS
jgi:hypothetical protein